jgi:hypothetical protein
MISLWPGLSDCFPVGILGGNCLKQEGLAVCMQLSGAAADVNGRKEVR